MFVVACSGSSNGPVSDTPTSADGGTAPSPTGSQTPPPTGTDAGADATTGAVLDPNADGPFELAEKDATLHVAATGDDVAVHVAYPKKAGSYPVVLFGRGFQLSASFYVGYLKRLASFGYVALTVEYPTGFSGLDNPAEATDLLAGIDWAKADPTFGASVDATKVGTSGHSLGGKIALLAATKDPRVKASIVLDPVDGGENGCTAPSCVGVAALLPSLHVPTGFLGETTDATGSIKACAPAEANFTTFYAKANSPSFSVTVAGASHVSFVDDVNACGFYCSFCNAPTASNAEVTALAKAYLVAFYERHLRGKTDYDAYLTGADANARYVSPKKASIASK